MWESPISASLVASSKINFGDLAIDGNDIYWTETKADENGRSVIVRHRENAPIKIINRAPYDVKSKVHEYGGGSFCAYNGTVFFSNFTDQKIYRVKETDKDPEPITSNSDNTRYADYLFDNSRKNLIGIRETHSESGSIENCIVAIDTEGRQKEKILAEGADFYSSPRLSPDAKFLAWIQWDHPNMPWDSTELWVAELDNLGDVKSCSKIQGFQKESVCDPSWSPEGKLHFVSDVSGWWNIYKQEDDDIINITPFEAEFTQPKWGLGSTFYGFVNEKELFCAFNKNGQWSFGTISHNNVFSDIKFNHEINDIGRSGVKVHDNQILLSAGSHLEQESIFLINGDGLINNLRSSCSYEFSVDLISVPETIEFRTENAEIAHGFFYPPRNPKFYAPNDELPPLLVLSHGGPTGSTSTAFNVAVQFWTTRGFAVLDVNYRGSTGYGSRYRKSLYGKWGISDVQDCINGADFLARDGRVDKEKLAIRGSSAGGFTTLAALTFTNKFQVGASYYGISDLEALAIETHKFESHYMESLIGKYPENKKLYFDRSPLMHSELLSCPIILFQGSDDKVVPPNQSQRMANSLETQGIKVSYTVYDGEGHGFRKPANIEDSLNSELEFYLDVLPI